VSGAGDVTADLATFRAAYARDDNLWWTLDCGHHQNLFEAACDQLDALADAAEALGAGAQTSVLVVTQGRPDLGLPPSEERWYTVPGRLLDALNTALIAYRAAPAPAGVRMAEYPGGDPT
jgi:hypothetical protein